MKYKSILTIAGVFIFSFVFSPTHAQSLMADVKGDVDVDAGVEVKINSNQNAKASTTTNGELTSSERKSTSTIRKEDDDRDKDTKEKSEVKASTTANVKGKLMSEEHRSVVAAFVKSLLNVAKREGGIGAEVRVIANNQNDSGTTTATAIAKIENKGFLKTLLFGSDYKNLGAIRSEMATTTNNIKRLQALVEKTTSASDKAELNLQIQALLAEQTKLEAYLKANENTFSLFGWFVKWFD